MKGDVSVNAPAMLSAYPLAALMRSCTIAYYSHHDVPGSPNDEITMWMLKPAKASHNRRLLWISLMPMFILWPTPLAQDLWDLWI